MLKRVIYVVLAWLFVISGCGDYIERENKLLEELENKALVTYGFLKEDFQVKLMPKTDKNRNFFWQNPLTNEFIELSFPVSKIKFVPSDTDLVIVKFNFSDRAFKDLANDCLSPRLYPQVSYVKKDITTVFNNDEQAFFDKYLLSVTIKCHEKYW